MPKAYIRSWHNYRNVAVALVLGLGLAWAGCTSDFTGPGNNNDAGEVGCGNAVLDPGEVCDGTDFGGQDCQSAVGQSMGTLICTAACGLDLSGCHDCGNGVLDEDETCDDANEDEGDGCAGCQLEPGWTCAGTPSVCATICGDGRVLGVEACDDGNTTNGDGCTGGCAGEVGWVCSGEPSVCNQTCGNGVADPGEACDDGNLIFDDGCSPSCVVDSGYGCDGWPSLCEPVCGDGLVRPGEACDDGNAAAGDGCLDDCTVETGWDCDYSGNPPQGCVPICGDGLLLGGEACDDGNPFSSDGCSNTCELEDYSACDGEPSQCICVVYVDRDTVPGVRNGRTWTTAYEHIDDGLSAAYSRRPCEVWVAEGTYYIYQSSYLNSISLHDDSTLYGGFDGTETWRDQRDWGAHPTVISAEQEGDPTDQVRQIFRASGDTNVIIDGFTISDAYDGNEWGGAMEIDNGSSVDLRNVVFSDNRVLRGGAIYLSGGSQVTITDATFLSNVADIEGGAIFADGWGAVIADRCLFQGNQATQVGGAVSVDGPDLDVTNSHFYNNVAGDYGGAIRVESSSFALVSSVLSANNANLGGGAVSLLQNGSPSTVYNCTFYENTSMAGNGATIRVENSNVDIVNSILWGSTTDQVFETSSSTDIDYCNIYGGAAGSGNIDQPPLFVSAVGGDLRLAAGSPGIDAANAFVAPTTDIDGNPRADDPNTFNSGAGNPAYVDMGAYEFQP